MLTLVIVKENPESCNLDISMPGSEDVLQYPSLLLNGRKRGLQRTPFKLLNTC